MKTKVRYVGLDVHKFTITIAVAEEGDGVIRLERGYPIRGRVA
jgi:hypothetical protein